MTSSATSSFNLTGLLKLATARRTTPLVLSQIIAEIEGKASEVNVPANTTSVQSIALGLAPGVTEVLFMALYAPKALIIEMTFTDTNNSQATAGPVRMGLKGHHIMTLSPGEGLTALGAINLSTSEDVTLDYMFGAIEKAGDIPSFWE